MKTSAFSRPGLLPRTPWNPTWAEEAGEATTSHADDSAADDERPGANREVRVERGHRFPRIQSLINARSSG